MRPRPPQEGWSPRLAADKAGGRGTWDKLPSLLKPQLPQGRRAHDVCLLHEPVNSKVPTSSGCPHKKPL